MSFCFSVRAGVGFYLPSLGEGLGVGVSPPPFGRGWEGVLCSFVLLSDIKWGIMSFCLVYAPNGALICQPRATPGELDAAWIRPRRGQKNDSPPLESGKGVGEIIILLPILGEC